MKCRYKLYVGINYPSGEKTFECSPDGLNGCIQAIREFLTERDADGFVFTVVREEEKDE